MLWETRGGERGHHAACTAGLLSSWRLCLCVLTYLLLLLPLITTLFACSVKKKKKKSRQTLSHTSNHPLTALHNTAMPDPKHAHHILFSSCSSSCQIPRISPVRCYGVFSDGRAPPDRSRLAGPPISIDIMPATPAGISSELRTSSKANRYAELLLAEHASQLTAAGHAGLATPRTPSNRDPTRFHHRRDSGMRRIEASSTGETYDIRMGQARGVSSSW